ncbi:aspartate ammonia-lyase [bacterium]|nr:aspartate ammonia-lyase [bacterium]|tara:strand:+ start:3576 stop:4892 length:1317 start_codon:yes stop_codon:yes gene_type:complete
MNKLYGKETQLAIDNFKISSQKISQHVISAIALIKYSMAKANSKFKLLEKSKLEPIQKASQEVMDGKWLEQFPIDVFQTGSGTSTHMNVNEVVAKRSSELSSTKIDAHDDLNIGQSSNDVIPSSIQIAAALAIKNHLIPSLKNLINETEALAQRSSGLIKTGRTHLMDALPIKLEDEIKAWKYGLEYCLEEISDCLKKLSEIPLGGTAVGSGANSSRKATLECLNIMSEKTSLQLKQIKSPFLGMSIPLPLLIASSRLKNLSSCLYKISNDLRWMNSGPLAGLSEIKLPKLQPGSSIMPGKVNPVIPEAVCQACFQVQGNDNVVTNAVSSGSFQLNVTYPLISKNLLESIELLSNSMIALSEKGINSIEFNKDLIQERLWKNPILVTALNSRIGYKKASKIAQKAYNEKRSILDVASEMTNISKEELKEIMDPGRLSQ